MEPYRIVIALIVICVFVLFLLCKRKYSYWARQKVPFVPPRFPFGNFKGIGTKYHISQLLLEHYVQMKRRRSAGPYCGIYLFFTPVALLFDLDLIKLVLVKDFQYFQDRGLFYNERDDPLSAHLLTLNGEQWRPLRNRLTSTFSSGKMKYMFPTVVKVADQLHECLSRQLAASSDGQSATVELQDWLARFTTDIIGTCAFGIECNSLRDPRAQFRAMGQKVFGNRRNSPVALAFMTTFKTLARSMGMKDTHDDVSEFFILIVNETIDYRIKNDVKRNDFIDLMIDLRNADNEDSAPEAAAMTINQIAAQAYVFFLAGFETSSTTMLYALYELSLNESLQSEARSEIEETIRKHNGTLTYEAMMEMNLIDRIISGKVFFDT